MDIIADGLWAVVAGKAANKKLKKPINAWIAGFWGMFPDIFSFFVAAVWVGWELLFGTFHFSDLPRHPEPGEGPPQNAFWVFQLSYELYNISHSIVIFFVVFFLAWVMMRRPYLELFGWLIHIIVDVPTHTIGHFPTPFLWPLSEWKFDGFAWWEFPLVSAGIYAVLFTLLYLLRSRKKKESAR